MKNNLRLLIVVLMGLVLGASVLRFKTGPRSLAGRLVSADDADRNLALNKFQGMKGERRDRVVSDLVSAHSEAEEPRKRVFALYALRKSGVVNEAVVDTLIRGLGDDDESVAEEAEVGLREIGGPAISGLLSKMEDPTVRSTAAQIMKLAQPDVLAPIEAALNGPDAGGRRAAATLLSHAERPETLAEAKRFVPALSTALSSDDSGFAVNAAFALHRLEPSDPLPVEVFLSQVRQEDWDAWDVRGWDALAALAAMPAAHAKTAPALLALLPSAPDGLQKNRRFKRAAIGDALDRILPRSRATFALATDLKSRDFAIRWRAAHSLSTSTQVDPALLSPLVGALSDDDLPTAARAFAAIVIMGVEKTDRAAAAIHPKMKAAHERIGTSVPGFQEMAAPVMEKLAGI